MPLATYTPGTLYYNTYTYTTNTTVWDAVQTAASQGTYAFQNMNTTFQYTTGAVGRVVSWQIAPLSQEQIVAERAAKEKAERLLVSVLNRRQRHEFREHGHFHVFTRNGVRKYRLKPGSTPVRVRGEDGEQAYFCIYPHGVPMADRVVAQKLMLETDEDAFLRIANKTRVAVPLAA